MNMWLLVYVVGMYDVLKTFLKGFRYYFMVITTESCIREVQ